MDIFKKLNELNFPLGKYVLVGSGPLAARSLREASDLDIAVTPDFWQELLSSGRYEIEERYGRQFLAEKGSSDVDIIGQLDREAYPTTVQEAIAGADIINGFPFLSIPETIKFKKALGREKDFRDIKLLEEYLEKTPKIISFENKEDKKYPKVGVGVMIKNDKDEVLLGLRQGSHGAGEWSFPGGHLEMGETLFATAKRETKEETGLDIDEFELISVADEMRYLRSDGKHYLNIGFKGNYQGGEVQLMEPDKCLEWKWFSLNDLPENLFEGTELTIKNYKNKTIYS